MQAGKQLDTSKSLPGFGLTSDGSLVLQTSPNKEFIQSPRSLSKHVENSLLNMVGTLLSKMQNYQKAIPHPVLALPQAITWAWLRSTGPTL